MKYLGSWRNKELQVYQDYFWYWRFSPKKSGRIYCRDQLQKSWYSPADWWNNCGVYGKSTKFGTMKVYDNMGYGNHRYLSHNSKYSRFNFSHLVSTMETRLPQTIPDQLKIYAGKTKKKHVNSSQMKITNFHLLIIQLCLYRSRKMSLIHNSFLLSFPIWK